MSSLPMNRGDTCRMRGNNSTFKVLEFDGRMYRLESEHGAELRAGRHAVQCVFEPKEKAASRADG